MQSLGQYFVDRPYPGDVVMLPAPLTVYSSVERLQVAAGLEERDWFNVRPWRPILVVSVYDFARVPLLRRYACVVAEGRVMWIYHRYLQRDRKNIIVL